MMKNVKKRMTDWVSIDGDEELNGINGTSCLT